MLNPYTIASHDACHGEDLQRILARLGYTRRTILDGVDAFEGHSVRNGQDVLVVILDRSKRAAPESLMDPVWVGYYDPQQDMEMVDDAEFSTLAEFLLEHLAKPRDLPEAGQRATRGQRSINKAA